MIDTHRGAFEYDWRTRFHKPLTIVGKSMTWGEAIRLTKVLSLDPGSAISAALQGWAYGMSREGLLLALLYDLQHASKAKHRPDPHPRPWPDGNQRHIGRTRLSIDQLKRVLAAARDVVDPVD